MFPEKSPGKVLQATVVAGTPEERAERFNKLAWRLEMKFFFQKTEAPEQFQATRTISYLEMVTF